MANPTSHLAGVDFLSTWKRQISDLITGNGEADAPDAAEVQNKFNDQRAALRKNADDLGFDGDYRPKAVNGTDEFDKPDLATLRAKVDKIDLEAVTGLVEAWKEIATRNTTSLDEFRKQIARGMSPDVWSGAAAAAAAQTVAAYDITGKLVTTAAALTSYKLDELRTGLEPTKNLVPHPPAHRSGGVNLHNVIAGRGWRNDDVAQWNAKVEAVRVLETVYAPVIHESDTNVPIIPVPKAIEDTGGDPGDPGGTRRTDTGNPSTGTPGTTEPAAVDPETTPEPPAETADTTTDDDSPATTEDTDDSTSPDSTDPQSTDPTATTPSGINPAAAGGGNPAGTPGGGSGGGGSPGAGAPSPGGAVAGAPSTTGNRSGAVRAAGSAAGAAGRAGVPGMMAPGARGGGKDDESTNGVPDYLVTQEHGDELTGLDEPPNTVPPVIGAD
ncbi:hypothetical protein [Nocardia asteroides]|uniref:hypothetical protein n=1 Tax=Nocardia asteroides TaxID=1824 RepID=UPI001E3C5F8F|nr:hypothetical protein [Nocardia asteroides]UGT58287.1 hypothetical protein LTT85_16220 [Nocardia asteroides]